MSPQISQSVGTSHSLAMHRGHRKPSLLSSEWQAQRARGEVSGNRVGKPIIIKSADADPGPPVRPVARWAGGGISSKRRSLKCPSFRATPNVPSGENSLVLGSHMLQQLTTSLVTKLATNLHLSRQGNHRYPNFVTNTSF